MTATSVLATATSATSISGRERCRVERAVAAVAGPLGAITRHDERRWASATFAGTRNRLTLEFSGNDGLEAARDFAAAVPHAVWWLCCGSVVDAVVTAASWQLAAGVGAAISIELLVLADG